MNPRHFLHRSAFLMAASLGPRSARGAFVGRKQRLHIGAETNAFDVPISRLLDVVATLGKLGYERFETNVRALQAGDRQPADGSGNLK